MAASTTEGRIADALCGHLAALVLSPVLPVAYPDVAFTKPETGAWLEAMIFDVPTEAFAIANDGTNIHSGLMQITVCAPEGIGSVNSRDIAGQIIAHFARGTRVKAGSITVRIDKPGSIGPLIPDQPYTRTPVTIRFELFASQ